MTIRQSGSGAQEFDFHVEPPGSAPDLAAVAALIEIGDRLGILPLISEGEQTTLDEISHRSALPTVSVAAYLDALRHAALIEVVPGQPDRFRTVSDFATIRYQAGYLAWALGANRPFIEHSREFLEDFEHANDKYQRDGRQVAITSQWMGSRGFYPVALQAILSTRPHRFVDLGAGSGRLLIEVLLGVIGSTGVALDIDPGACREAERAATEARVIDRMTIVCQPIQSVADDPSVLESAEAVHAGFVLHDMMPKEEDIADRVLANCYTALRDGGTMFITEAVPYVDNEREQRFSSIVTYFHQQFMGRKLLTEEQWKAKLSAAGFAHVASHSLNFPTGRLFIASKL